MDIASSDEVDERYTLRFILVVWYLSAGCSLRMSNRTVRDLGTGICLVRLRRWKIPSVHVCGDCAYVIFDERLRSAV
jgi:hypothetical protein